MLQKKTKNAICCSFFKGFVIVVVDVRIYCDPRNNLKKKCVQMI